MADDSRRNARTDADGVRYAPRVSEGPRVRKGVWMIAGALGLVAAAILVIGRLLSAPSEADSVAPTPSPNRAAAAPPPQPAESERSEPPRRPARAVAHAEPPPAPVAPLREREDPPIGFGPPGEKSGIALFPPPGTKPIKRGIVVPEDFELPPGYVRHYQATDDGQRVPAILMFSPDFDWVDADGKRVELPADRIVPPEMAPPGLPIRMLELPGEPGQAGHTP